MIFYINQVFEGVYPPEAAVWCNNNNAYIEPIEPDGYIIREVPEPTPEELSKELRSKRDKLLRDTDKYLISDYPISPEDLEAVKVYRQALRDIPEQSGFPKNVQWPVEPQFLSAKKKNEE